jgi:hypothetical protein
MIISTTRRSTKHHLKAAKLQTKSSLTIDIISSACIVGRGQRRGPIVARWLSFDANDLAQLSLDGQFNI